MSLDISKEELEEMYWGEPETNMGCTLIARKLNCGKSTIYRYLKKYNIPIRPPTTEGNECITKETRRNAGNKHLKTQIEITKEMAKKIYEEYKNTNITIDNLSKKRKLSLDTIKSIVHAKHWTTEEKEPIYEHKGKRLDKQIVLEIYNKTKEKNISYRKMADKYNVSKSLVSLIVNAKHPATKNKDPRPREYVPRGEQHPRIKITKEQGIKIYNDFNNGQITREEIMEKHNISRSVTNRIISCRHWTTKHLAE